MPVTPIEVENTLYIYIESSGSRVVRTGLLGYYDPLMMTDLFNLTLGELSVRDDTLPSSVDAIIDDLPAGINAHKFDLIIG